MENDGDAAALGEAGWGAGRNKSRLIYVTVGTGIGTGIISTARFIAESNSLTRKLDIT